MVRLAIFPGRPHRGGRATAAPDECPHSALEVRGQNSAYRLTPPTPGARRLRVIFLSLESYMFPLIAALVLIAARLPAQQPERYAIEPLVSQLAEGYIDWTQHALFAYGDGTAPAAVSDPVQQRLHGLRHARDAAFRTMRELIGQVRLNADTQLQDAGLDRDFQELVRVAIGSQSEDQGRYRIAVRLLLLGDFAAAVLPQVEPIDPRSHDLSHFDDSPAASATPDSLTALATADSLAMPSVADSLTTTPATDSLTTPSVPDSLAVPITADSLTMQATTDSLAMSVVADSLTVPVATDSLAAPATADSLAAVELVFFVPEAPYTGLLVDVRGLGLQPSIAPRVLSADGHVIHGVATVDRSLAIDYGVAGYDDDHQPRLHQRAARRGGGQPFHRQGHGHGRPLLGRRHSRRLRCRPSAASRRGRRLLAPRPGDLPPRPRASGPRFYLFRLHLYRFYFHIRRDGT